MSEIIEVPFYAESVQAVKSGESVSVVIKRVCESLGLAHQSQLEKLKAKPWACVTLIVMQVPGDTQSREIACLDLDSLPMWLATIDANRVKPEARFKLVAYQKECARVLRDHFFGCAPKAEPSEHLKSITATLVAQAAALGEMRAAIASLSERSNAVVTRSEARSMAGRITRAGALKAFQMPRRTAKAWAQRIRMHVMGAAGWSGAGYRYDNMPAHAYPQAERALSLIERELSEGRQPPPANQLSLVKTA